MRLDKYLADASVGTRSRVKELIRKKQVSVDGSIVTDPAFHLSEGQTVVCQGNQVSGGSLCYYMFHKPAGCVTATRDRERTVMAYFSSEAGRGLFPVGRLDKDTEGLLLVTNDGAFSHRLMSPRKHVEKIYYFEGEGRFSEGAADMVRQGIDIGDEKPTKPAKLHYRCCLAEDAAGADGKDQDETAEEFGQESLDRLERSGKVCADANVRGLIAITEGRYHQVKRMLARLGVTVVYLKRIAIGKLYLDESLAPGSYRRLTEAELAELLG